MANVVRGEHGNGRVADYRYDQATRKNNPPAGLAAQGRIAERPAERYAYNPHLPPVLRFDPTGEADRYPDFLEEARRRPLTAEEIDLLAGALRHQEPWLEWSGKRERKQFEVDPVALHIHERVSTKAILAAAARQDIQRSLFADPQQDYRDAVRFYEHDVEWSNRLILGDSVAVMSSLAKRENLAGQVQMIYIDPPYGIKFASNFQSQVGQRDVKDRPGDLTREPEMVKAYRDTWALGLHSYLSYLRDRLVVARELLSDGGSIFFQIGDENVHVVRNLLDEVFGKENFCSQIQFKKTGYASTILLPNLFDYVLWYAKDMAKLRYRSIYHQRGLDSVDTAFFDTVEAPDGERRTLTAEERSNPQTIPADFEILARNPLVSPGYVRSLSQPIKFNDREFACPPNAHWKTTPEGLTRLAASRRLIQKGNTLRMVRYLRDLSISPLTNVWTDTAVGGFVGDARLYVVQTDTRVIQRCMLMTTEPGDLVLDPTCGSGSTAYVAERWGRRWITIDTSRVALAIARQRLLTSTFDHYKLRDDEGGPSSGFHYNSVPHITLKSIAQNTALDPIIAKHLPILDDKLTRLNVPYQKSLPQSEPPLPASSPTKNAPRASGRSPMPTAAGGSSRKIAGRNGKSPSMPTRTGPSRSRTPSLPTELPGARRPTKSTPPSLPAPSKRSWLTSPKSSDASPASQDPSPLRRSSRPRSASTSSSPRSTSWTRSYQRSAMM
jgi:adenine-specific DNA-methyltransferase